MLGKIVQLLGKPMEDGFSVVEGIEFCKLGTAEFEFAEFKLYHNPSKNGYKVIYCWELSIKEQHDGFKEVLVNNLEHMPEEKCVEERLWVLIPWASEIKTSCEKIAGRYPQEAIIEMKAGDVIAVDKEIYMAVQTGNEMFLVKKNR